MLVKFRIPEILFGALLTVAIFAMGFVVASSMPPPSQQIEKADHPQAANEGAERTAEKQIAYYTKWLAWFTGALVAVSGIQGYFLLRADRTARIAAEAARGSADLGRKEYAANRRPRLIVRRISIDEPRPRGGISTVPCLQIQYVIANIGDNRAYVTDNYANLYFVKSGERLPALPPFEGERNTIGPMELGNGVSKPIIINTSEKGGRFLETKLAHGDRMYFLGYIQYRDDLGNERRTAFCRGYSGKNKRFHTISVPDYDYVD
jgi:hypothetical protein